MKKYTSEELRKIKDFESMMHLQDLKVGELITQRHVEAVAHLFVYFNGSIFSGR